MSGTLLSAPQSMLAQHGGGGGAAARGSRPLVCIHDCPSTTEASSTGDDLKNFQHLMAVQATDQQNAAFLAVAHDTQSAREQLQAFRDGLQKTPPASGLSDCAAALNQALEKARAGIQQFLASFSSAQKTGLKDITDKLSKADAELDKQTKALAQVVQTAKASPEQISAVVADLDKSLASFESNQVALANEMSIMLPASGQDQNYRLALVTNSVNIAGQAVSISAAGSVTHTSTANGNNLYAIKLNADLSDLQEKTTNILRAQLTRNPRCGERISIPQAKLTALLPASLVVTRVHYEHWICPPFVGAEPTELAVDEGDVEIKLTPSLGQDGELKLLPEVGRIDGDDFLRDLLGSGSVGVMVRDQVTAVMLSAMQKGTDLKTTLPPAAVGAISLQKAKFEEPGPGRLSLVIDGQLQLTDEQAKDFANQLKQRSPSQEAASR